MAKKKISPSKLIIGGVLILTGLYVICLIGLTLAQRRLIYYPCNRQVSEIEPGATKRGFRRWCNWRGEFIGWSRFSPSSNTLAKILLLHGNAGCAADWVHYAEAFQAVAPCDFYILEYPGYGGRPRSA